MFINKLVLSLCLLITLEYFEINAKRVFYLDRNADLIKFKSDYPSSRKDLFDYVKSLEGITKFAWNYKQFLDINFCFGLFVVNVNLRPSINHAVLTESIRDRIWNILKINDKLIEDFVNTNIYKKDNNNNQLIWSHMRNETAWTKRLKKFNFDLLIDGKMNRMLGEDPNFKMIYPDWTEYLYSVNHIDESFPDPKSSDKCLVSLSENEENPTDQYQRCNFSEKCKVMLLNGNNFGYSLTHRFLHMVLARISKGCYIFSPAEDEELRRKMCEMMYEESKYIASNEFKLIDLLLEEVSLCSLDGHAQFLHRSWLSALVSQQSSHGCFNQRLGDRERYEGGVLDGDCNTHVTAVAAAALAAAVRFILELY